MVLKCRCFYPANFHTFVLIVEESGSIQDEANIANHCWVVRVGEVNTLWYIQEGDEGGAIGMDP